VEYFAVLAFFGLLMWFILRTSAMRGENELLRRRIDSLDRKLSQLAKDVAAISEPAGVSEPAAEPPATAVPPTPDPTPEKVSRPVPPPVFETPRPQPPEVRPVLPPIPQAPAQTPRAAAPSIDFEQFLGVKGFAYAAGLAGFFGVALFVRYSFQQNWITPELRVALGFLFGIAMLAGGSWLLGKRQYAVGAQTLCATGIVILYAVTFACRAIYHFAFFGPLVSFLLMALITTTALLLAIRSEALVVAVLGMLGGFLTPILINTGQDNPLGLFGYILFLDAGLIIVAMHRRWYFLTSLAALGTVVMQIGWAGRFFVEGRYFEGNHILVALAALLVFDALYLAAVWWAKSRRQSSTWLCFSALGLNAVTLAFTLWFLSFEPLGARPWLMFGFVFVVDVIVTALTLLDDAIAPAQPAAGIAVFLLLAIWTAVSLRPENLNAALACFFVFAAFHSAFPVFLKHRRGSRTTPWVIQIFPPIAIALVLIPLFQIDQLSFMVWPFVMMVDLLAIGLAALTASLLPVFAVMLLTLFAIGGLMGRVPQTLDGLSGSLVLLGLFAVFFVAVSTWIVRRIRSESAERDTQAADLLSVMLPACSAALPFMLLIMATLRLPLSNPSPVFGLALLLVILLLGLARIFIQEWMPAVALASVSSLEFVWHFNRFNADAPSLPLVWYLLFFAAFAVYPFVFRRHFATKTVPWAVAAVAGLPHFFLIHRLVDSSYPNHTMGLLPAAFAIPPLLSLVLVLKISPEGESARMTKLAWFGGIALLFITLIFPIQFDRQWITLGWALEGVALLWLFHRVPHRGLPLAGLGLLAAAFIRLALNPAVLEYYPRGSFPILNWYLYSYGIVTLSLFVGARLLAPPRNVVRELNVPPILSGLGTALAFLLLNIEIADFFTAPGDSLSFDIHGNLARDTTYSIAWAMFALILLTVGLLKKIPAPRYAALVLLSVTLVKLFFHDLAQLDQLYRIGAFLGVAAMAMLASFSYQRFFSEEHRK